MSIRLRLTLVYSAILATTLFIFGITLYAIQAESTIEGMRKDLRTVGENLTKSLMMFLVQPNPRDPWFGMPPREFLANNPPFGDIREREIVRVLDASGNLIASPLGEQGGLLPLSDAGLQALQQLLTWWEIGSYDGEEVLVYSIPVAVNQELVLIVQAGRWMGERSRSLSALAQTLTIAGVLTIVAAFGIGWLLSGLTLRPIHRITQTAQAIGNERDFGRRVDYRGPPDEVGQLATTFNAMLARLQDSYQQVAELLDKEREFVADVSHELRTPLTTLQGNLALLQRQPPIPDEEARDILGDMSEESQRLIRLVNELLVLARADARISVQLEPVAVLQVIEETVNQARLLAGERAIEVAALAEVQALADRDGLKQVLLILLDNAIKYAEGRITVKAWVEGQRVCVSVSDKGPGVPVERLERIFERFYRDDEVRVVNGFGLGLAIARALVEGQGGQIEVSSQVGEGTTFTISLARVESKP